MTSNQGVKIGAFLVCFSLAVNLLGGLGVSAAIGVEKAPGIDGEKIANKDKIQNPEGNLGGISGVIGLATTAIGTVATLGEAVTGTYTMLTALDVPAPIAVAVQAAVDIGFAIGIAAVIRGLRNL